MAITTAMLTSFKRDLMNGLHHFAQTRTFTGSAINGGQSLTGVSALTGAAVGNFLSGTGITAGTRISDILSANSVGISKPTTAAITGGTITMSGDIFKIALIKVGMAGTYGVGSVGYADITANTDETTGTGYTAGGQALVNVDPAISGTTAFTDFAPDPSWTSASFSTAGCMIYNTTQNGPNATPGCSVHDFGGTQTVTSGTFTAVFPNADAANAILRIA